MKQKNKIKKLFVIGLVVCQLFTGMPYDAFAKISQNIIKSKLIHHIASKTLDNERLVGVLQNFRLEPTLKTANAAVTPKGVAIWAETASDDIVQFGSYTSPSTYTDVGDSVDVTTNTNDLYHLRVETAPTRNEVMAGFLEDTGSDGTLHVTRCVGDCDASGDWSEELEIAGVHTTDMVCDGTPAACTRPFDLAYEQLSGDLIVFYGKTGNDGVLFYNVWNGSSWAGESSYTFEAQPANLGENSWVEAVPEGEGLVARRSDRILLLVRVVSTGAGTAEGNVFIWSGSSFGNLETFDEGSANTHAMGGAWESLSGNALVVFGIPTGTSTTPFYYKKFTNSGSTWDSSDTQTSVTFTAAQVGAWVQLQPDPNSNRIAAAFQNGANDARPSIWKADGSTEGWTDGTEDADIEGSGSTIPGISVAWEHTNGGTPMAMFVKSDNNTDDQSDYETWISGTGFSGWTDMPPATTTLDDTSTWKVFANPNSDEIMALELTWDDDLYFQKWDGSSWDSAPSSAISTTIPPDTNDAHNENLGFDFTYRYYSSWGRNWRFYTDVTSNTPSTGLAAENTTGYMAKEQLIRLRMQFVELNDIISQTDTRKKLQYTSGCNPNTTNEYECTWTNVGDVTATTDVWRYTSQANGDSVCSNCNDNTALGSTSLTGSGQSGSFITDKDAASGTNMDANANTIVEYDYPLKAEAVTAGTTYYFRAVDVDTTNTLQINLRRQDTGTTDCLSAACTYPSVTIDPDITQNDFEFWVDNDLVTPTDAWGNPDVAENTYLNAVPVTNDPVDVGDEIRIRMNFTVSTSLAASQRGFILQYGQGADCTAISSWTDVDANGGAGVWRYATSTVTDNTTLASLLISTSDVLGRYNKSDPTTTNPNSASAGQDVEWDWHLEYNSSNSPGAKTYCFRMIRDNSFAFETYNSDGYPKVDIAPTNSDFMRHGNFFSEGSEKGFFW